MKYLIFFSLLVLAPPVFLHAQNGSFKETVSFIRKKVDCCAVPFTRSKPLRVSSIDIDINGLIKLSYSPRKAPNSFNLYDLLKTEDAPFGIQLNQQSKFIQFHVSEERTRLISFSSYEEAKLVYEAFLHLLELAGKKPAEAKYFIGRNTEIPVSNSRLFYRIRAQDQTGSANKIEFVRSQGEGWLDKDSMPVGHWKFYAWNEKGKEYLFKEGLYQRTNSEMFEIVGIDSAELQSTYHISTKSMQEYRSEEIPFIKSGRWNFFQPDGKLLKTVEFINCKIPITVSILMEDPARVNAAKLVVLVNETPDEWTE